MPRALISLSITWANFIFVEVTVRLTQTAIDNEIRIRGTRPQVYEYWLIVIFVGYHAVLILPVIEVLNTKLLIVILNYSVIYGFRVSAHALARIYYRLVFSSKLLRKKYPITI
jgi:hypothetical protein